MRMRDVSSRFTAFCTHFKTASGNNMPDAVNCKTASGNNMIKAELGFASKEVRHARKVIITVNAFIR